MNDGWSSLQMRVHGDTASPTLIYLPGIHGDWTLIPDFRAAVKSQLRFVEFTYPRALDWSLDDYARGVEECLAAQGITRGWLLGESFGSQVVWALRRRELESPVPAHFNAEGIILAGGFVRYPWRWPVRLAQVITAGLSEGAARFLFRLYALYARWRHRRSPETLAGVREFIRRRLEPADRQAILHRLQLIAENDPEEIARRTDLPVYALAGSVDPIVPMLPVRVWLRRHCPGYRGGRVLLGADHTVLATVPKQSAAQVRQWLAKSP